MKPKVLIRRRARPAAGHRLYCFPHSGGAAAEYVRWADATEELEVWAAQLPGRAARIAEVPHPRMADAVAEFAAQHYEPPYAFFGHSLGALVAYETAYALEAAGAAGPTHVFVSACSAPHFIRPRVDGNDLDDRQLFERLQSSYASLPAETLDDPDLLAVMMAPYRADAALLRAYAPEPRARPLRAPITAVLGADDDVPAEHAAAWRTCTRAGFTVVERPGGHFYHREDVDGLLRYLVSALSRTAPTTTS